MRRRNVSDIERLYHITDGIAFILSHTNISEEAFYKDAVLKKAVVRDLEVIGEAAHALSETIKEQYKEIPWQQIVATRHRIIHEYFDVNYKTVWSIIKNDLPALKEKIETILAEIK